MHLAIGNNYLLHRGLGRREEGGVITCGLAVVERPRRIDPRLGEVVVVLRVCVLLCRQERVCPGLKQILEQGQEIIKVPETFRVRLEEY